MPTPADSGPVMKNPKNTSQVSEPAAAGAAEVAGLIKVMAKLRAEGGCPWDREQTWNSLRRYVLEEAHELVDAVDREDPAAVLEECGDLLLEVVFMAQIAHEEGRFGMAEVARGITRKLIRRHPHVFGDQARASNADEALASWEAIKAAEKSKRAKQEDALPRGLPALLLAVKAIERATPARTRGRDGSGRHPSRPDPDAGGPAGGRSERNREGPRRPPAGGCARGSAGRTRPRVGSSKRGSAAADLEVRINPAVPAPQAWRQPIPISVRESQGNADGAGPGRLGRRMEPGGIRTRWRTSFLDNPASSPSACRYSMGSFLDR